MLSRRHPAGRCAPARPGGSARLGRGRAVLCVALISLGLVIAQFVRLGHMMLVSHSICEHGTLVHDHHADQDRHPAHQDQGTAETAQPDDTPGDADHEHCDTLGRAEVSLAVGPSCVVPTLLDGELLPWSVRPRQGERVIAILSLAPKNSPPA